MLCPACGQKLDPIGSIPVRDFDGSIFNLTSQVLECKHCGFARMDTGLSDKEITDHYSNASLYSALSGVGVGGCTPEDLVRYRHYTSFAGDERLQSGRFADIGCSRGGFVKYLSEHFPNLDVTGVDCDQQSLEVMTKDGLNALVGDVFNLPFDNASKDVLSYFHVLEHVYDVDALLREANRVLAPEGYLLIEVPGAAHYGDVASRVGTMFWIGMKEHVNHFSAASLYRYCERHGFGIVATANAYLPMKNGTSYPSLMILAQKGHATSQSCFAPSESSLTFHEHLQRESASLQEDIDKLAALTKAHDHVTFWGIGLEFLNFYAYFQPYLKGKTVHLADSNPAKQGLTVDGIPIVSPQKIPPTGSLICCSYLSGKEIAAAAINVGWSPELVFSLT